MKLRLFVSAVLMACALSSCATYNKITGITVSQSTASVAVQGAMVVQRAANTYLSLPICTASQTQLKDACRDKAASKKVATALQTLVNDKNALWADVVAAQKSGTSVGVAKAAYDALTADTSILQALF